MGCWLFFPPSTTGGRSALSPPACSPRVGPLCSLSIPLSVCLSILQMLSRKTQRGHHQGGRTSQWGGCDKSSEGVGRQWWAGSRLGRWGGTACIYPGSPAGRPQTCPPALRLGPTSPVWEAAQPFSPHLPSTLPGARRQQWAGTKTWLAHTLHPLELGEWIVEEQENWRVRLHYRLKTKEDKKQKQPSGGPGCVAGGPRASGVL